jgi:hypothetical protein
MRKKAHKQHLKRRLFHAAVTVSGKSRLDSEAKNAIIPQDTSAEANHRIEQCVDGAL